jgi:transposase
MQNSLDLDISAAELSRSPEISPRKAHVRQGRIFRRIEEEVLLPTDLRDLLPKGDASLWIREGLERIDLSVLRNLYTDCGGVPYDPRAMLGILLFAYFEGETGSRTIEKRCLRDVGYMHVGYGQRPDDRTIRRFRRQIGPVLGEVFLLVVRACKEEGLLPLRRVAVDGTKIASAASSLKRWLSKAEKEDVSEMGFEPQECSDPDARNLGTSGKFVRGYNCQAAVDCDSGIVAAVAVSNVSSDGHLLAPMVKEVVRNADQIPAEVVADAGYDTNEGASACAALEIEAYIAPQSSVGTFWSVTQDDEIVCPMGNLAVPAGVNNSNGKPCQVLRVVGCPKCPFFAECCGVSSSRTLAFPLGSDPIQRLNAAYRARSPVGRAAMTERMATIEPVFGDIKWNKGLSRFRLRGLDGASIEWTLMHLARNLAKLGKALIRLFWAVMQLLKAVGTTRNSTITAMHSPHAIL